jgi:hypothetical protein
MNQALFYERIKKFLADHTTLALATVAKDGRPYATALFYAETDDLSLIFISEQKTRHSQNIAYNNQVAVTVYADGQLWASIRGLQIEGRCVPLAGQAAKMAQNIYLQKFSFIQQNAPLRSMLNNVTFYQIVPAWVRLIDNSLGFGHKEEIWLPLRPEN